MNSDAASMEVGELFSFVYGGPVYRVLSVGKTFADTQKIVRELNTTRVPQVYNCGQYAISKKIKK